MKRNIERFPSKQMYPYLSLVERKVAEFYHIQEDRSGNSYEGSNGHIAKFSRDNKLTGDVHEEKTSFRIVSQSLELLK